jgi:hypothetical protein
VHPSKFVICLCDYSKTRSPASPVARDEGLRSILLAHASHALFSEIVAPCTLTAAVSATSRFP